MKAFTQKFGQVEILEKTDSVVVIKTETGENKRLMPKFIKFYDENGNEITDFSNVKDAVKIPANIGGKTSTGRKTSKIAEMQGAWMERNGYTKFNHLTKKFQ